jgi:surface antigen
VVQGCREYTAPVNVGGRIVQSYGTACLRPNGSWQIVN